MFSESKFFHGKNIFLEIFDEFGTLGTAIMWFFTCPMSHLGQKKYFSWDMGQVWDSYNVTLRDSALALAWTFKIGINSIVVFIRN